MIDALPAAPDPANDLPAVFSQKAAAMVLAQKAMVPQMNALAANLNSIAAGGAYAVPYTYRAGSQFQNAGGNVLSFAGGGLGNAATATNLYVDTVVAGVDIAALIVSMGASSSTVKGTLRVTALADPARWATFNIIGYTQSAGFVGFTVAPVASNVAYPFADYDQVVLQFTRAGDKGDASALTAVIHVRDTKTAGTDGGTNQANALNKRALNTVVRNTISGASVSSDSIVVPAGVYRINARVPAFNAQSHQAMLYANGNVAAFGSSAYSSGSETDSILFIELVFSVTVTLEIYHYMQVQSVNTGFGKSALGFAGHPEIYTDVFIEKVS